VQKKAMREELVYCVK